MPIENGIWVMPKAAAGSGPGIFNVSKGTKVPMFRVSELRALANSPIHNLSITRGIAMDIEQVAVETTGAANEALQTLKATLDKFRGTIANDLTAIKAASSRVQTETMQMKQAYVAAQSILTGPEFERAIINAERMAAALQSIAAVSDTSLSVSVCGNPAAK